MLLTSGVTREQLEEALEPEDDAPMSLEERRAMIRQAGGEVHG
jgi:hypothetical protein